jgi:hypothetical protein
VAEDFFLIHDCHEPFFHLYCVIQKFEQAE